MSDQTSNDSRRKLLKSLAAGSGAVVAGKSLPGSWSKPVIDSVMLPAHAETTDETGEDPTTTPDPCCDIAGNYCGSVSNEGMIEITVESSGALTINIDGGEFEVSSSVECDGGSFNTAEDNPNAPPGTTVVTGAVVCNKGPIVGQVIISGSQFSFDYTATIDGCFPSDIRLKMNIEALSTSRNGFNLYKFQYLADEHKNTYVGIMAQDVMAQHPEAIVKNEAGYYMVRYHELGLRMVTLEEWENKGPDSIELVN